MSDYYLFFTDNYFIPDHDFELNVSLAAKSIDGSFGGKMAVGVWIHTPEEQDHIYSWIPNKEYPSRGLPKMPGIWKRYATSSFTSSSTGASFAIGKSWLLNYSTPFPPGVPTAGTAAPRDKCYLPSDENAALGGGADVRDLASSGFFKNFTVPINTINSFIDIVKDNHDISKSQRVHRLSQNYIIEVFLIPNYSDTNIVFVLDSVSIIDKTLKDRATIEAEEGNLNLEKEDVVTIFTHFNQKGMEGNATRVAGVAPAVGTDSAEYYGTSGGSRLNYRIHPNWVTGPDVATALTKYDQVRRIQVDN